MSEHFLNFRQSFAKILKADYRQPSVNWPLFEGILATPVCRNSLAASCRYMVQVVAPLNSFKESICPAALTVKLDPSRVGMGQWLDS